VEQRLIDGEGAPVWTRLSLTLVTGGDGRPLYFVAHVLDVTETRRAQAELAYAATHDALTGLPNRVLLLDRIATALRRQRRSNRTSAVVIIDLDHFKVINDSLGHLAGDQVLRVVGQRIEEAVRPGDTTARLGGDEFVVFCDELDAVGTSAELTAITQRLCSRITAPIPVGGQEIVIGATIGAALADAWDPLAEDLLRDADVALYDAKRRGRGTYSLFDRQMRVRALERLDVESAMRQALETDVEMFPHFQPIVDLDSGRVVAVEALARWRRGGVLAAPGAFLEVAEESGLIVRLSEHIARLAAAQVASWRGAGQGLDGEPALRLCVNVSPKQLAREDFVERTSDMLALTGLPPSALVIEITEDTLLQAGPQLDRTLARLHDAGIRIALDDFGTGYSSLAYLQQLPVDILKIDRAFVVAAADTPGGTTLLHTFADLGRALNLNVVVEGVETVAQLEAVRAAGCQLVQGYLLGRPARTPDLAPRALEAAAG
jgi:diguanylate cyclase (GGDEF)-like protein